jgi:hypothetical protein
MSTTSPTRGPKGPSVGTSPRASWRWPLDHGSGHSPEGSVPKEGQERGSTGISFADDESTFIYQALHGERLETTRGESHIPLGSYEIKTNKLLCSAPT